ncbi:MAG: hypothetical protein ABL886_02815 [Rhodoglobus sp.]
MSTVPTAGQLLRLVELQRNILSGTEVTIVAGSLGPLSSFFAFNGHWRPEGPAVVRRMLDALLVHWSRSHPGVFRGISASDAAAGIRMLWGVDRPPATAASAGTHFSKSGRAVRAWEKRVVESPDVLKWLEKQIAPLVGHEPSMPRSVVETTWATWPNEPDRSALLAIARRTESARAIGDESLVRALRQLVNDAVSKYTIHSTTSKLARTIAQLILVPWERLDDLLFASPRPVEPIGGGGARAQAAVMIQLFAYDSTLFNSKSLQDEIDRREPSPLATGVLVGGPRLGANPEPLSNRERGAVAQTLSSVSFRLDLSEQSQRAARFLGTDRLLPSQALAVSEAIRMTSPSLRHSMIDHYIGLRERGQRSALPADPDLDEIRPDGMNTIQAANNFFALADQVVRLQAVHGRSEPQYEAFERIMRTDGNSYKYADLTTRDLGLIFAKTERKREGIIALSVALKNSERRRSVGESDLREQLEVLQQIELSLCGALTTLLEDHLVVATNSSHIHAVLPRLTMRVLQFSARAVGSLESISKAFGSLQNRRHEDGIHLSWSGWVETALQTRLRALLVARTVVDSGMVLRADLDQSQVDPSMIDHSSLEAVYRQIVTLPSLSGEAETRLGMQGTWLAMTAGGHIPWEEHAVASLARLAFLDGIGVNGVTRDVLLDAGASARWHNARGDIGTLGRVRTRSMAGVALSRTSGGAFQEWRTQLTRRDLAI